MNDQLGSPHCIQGKAAWRAVLLVFLLCLAPLSSVQAAPLRVALVCSGPSDDFYDILTGIAHGLKSLHIINRAPSGTATVTGDTKDLWRWLSANAGGEKLIFLADAFYSEDLTENKRSAVQEAIRTRLARQCDVDVILSFGTWATLDMVALNTAVPIVGCGITDAIDAGIVPSATDSGKDNLVAVLEPDRFQRQMELFHKFFAFRRLGITYNDTPAGRSIAAIPRIETACTGLGVELVRCTGNFFHNPDSNQIAEQMLACHKKFVEQNVDAVYITYNSLQSEQLQYVLQPLIQAKIPTISQEGPREVRMGVLTSISNYSHREGHFVAKLLSALLEEGARPRNLPQQLHSPLLLAINLHTASRIGWNPSLEVLMSVDKFYQ